VHGQGDGGDVDLGGTGTEGEQGARANEAAAEVEQAVLQRIREGLAVMPDSGLISPSVNMKLPLSSKPMSTS
jgi:hypothetical protein